MFSCRTNSHPYFGACDWTSTAHSHFVAPRSPPRYSQGGDQTTTKVTEVIESQRARLQTRGFFLLFVYLESRRRKLARGTGHTRGEHSLCVQLS